MYRILEQSGRFKVIRKINSTYTYKQESTTEIPENYREERWSIFKIGGYTESKSSTEKGRVIYQVYMNGW